MNALLESLTGLTLRDPWILPLALLVPVALLVRRWLGAPAVAFAPGAFIEPRQGFVDHGLPRSWRIWLLPLPRGLQMLGLLLVIFALARPVHRVQLPLEKEGIDIFLCLDVSSSMAANDLDPQRTRLDVVKAAAAKFITDRPDDRIGLVRFARYPDLVCPLTLDHGALKNFLQNMERVEPDGPEDMTGIGTAVARAGQTLRNSLSKSKVVILLTDGEENVARADTPEEIGPVQAAALCKELGVRVYTIAAGIGKQNQKGQWVPLDTSQVRRLANRTGGEFFEARDAGAVDRVYATIDELEKVQFAEPRYERKDFFLPFLIAAVLVMVLARTLRSTVFEVLP